MGTDRVSNLSKVILLVSDGARIWNQASQPGSTAHTVVTFSALLLPMGLRKLQDCCDDTLPSFCESLGMDMISF